MLTDDAPHGIGIESTARCRQKTDEKMARLANVYTPNKVRDAAKVAGLVAAYEAGEVVRPVIVIEYCDELHALSGSHRIAAMLQAFGTRVETDDLEEYVEIIAASDLDLSRDALAFLDSLRNASRDESRLVDMIACLPESVRAAMADQV